jgi:energy-coupling factor transporter ATP-binding protein EcfA2
MANDQREAQAKRLLDDPIFIESFDELEKELLSLWENTGAQDVGQRESFWLAMRLLNRIKAHITSIVETGHMAKMMEQHPYV